MSVIGQLSSILPFGTQMVLLMLLKLEQGRVPLGQILVSIEGLVTFTKAVPLGEPQILVPLNWPIFIGWLGQTYAQPNLV